MAAPTHLNAIGGGTFGYKLVGDNIDFTVKARYMRTDGRQDQSLHFFHSYAIRDRIDLSKFPFQSSPRVTHPTSFSNFETMALEMLPSSLDDVTLSKNIATIVSRVLFENMPFFKSTFKDVVTWHIQHKHYEDMSKKSEVVSFKSM